MSDKAIEQEIQAKGLTAPRVTPQRIQDVIAREHYFTAADGELYKQYKEDSLTLLQKFEKLLREKNGTPNGPLHTSQSC